MRETGSRATFAFVAEQTFDCDVEMFANPSSEPVRSLILCFHSQAFLREEETRKHWLQYRLRRQTPDRFILTICRNW